MTNLTAIETANLFGVSREAIRKYCIEFARYLSPVATPQAGRQRMFSENDLRVISTIVILKAEGKLFADIHAALGAGQLYDAPETPTTITTPNNQALVLTNQIAELRAELSASNGQVELLKEQLADTQGRLEKLIAENAVLKSKIGQG